MAFVRQVVFLAEGCNEPTYKKLVQGLCLEKNVPLVDVPDNKTLGEWAGLCKIDKDGNPRKVATTSSTQGSLQSLCIAQ